MQGHSETSTHQHHIHIPGYYPSYYQVGNAFTPPSFGPFFGASDHGQGTYPENATKSFDANPKNMFFLGLKIIESYVCNNLFYKGTRLSVFHFDYLVS